MRKVSILFLIILIISTFTIISFADEEAPAEEPAAEEVQESPEEIKEEVTNTYGKIIETNGIKEVVTGTVVDQVQEVVVEITEGDFIQQDFRVDYVLSYDLEGKMLVPELSVGDKVEVQITEDQEGNVTATVTEVSKTNHLAIILGIFLVSIVLISGKKGIRTIIGLVFTLLFLYFFTIRQLYNGVNAIAISIISAICLIVGTFIIIDGFNKKTVSAVIGTFGGVITAGIIALIFINLSKMTGAYEEAIFFSVNLSNVKFNFRDLLFAGIMISSLGACMDIGLSIVSALDEIKMTDAEVTWKELFKKGMSVGRENIGTMTNTLILAYLGTSLTLILLFLSSNMSLLDISNKERIVEQLMLAIIGSTGVVYTVPITSILYSLLNRHRVIYKKESENKIDGKRSLKI